MVQLTIFTPVYNRSALLGRLYLSLLKQTVKNFEWVIVDDGSNDNIQVLVDQWINENTDFEIKFYLQINSGKHVAHNNGVRHSEGTYFVCVDSDDWLEPDAVEQIIADTSLCKGYEGLIYPKKTIGQEAHEKWFPSGVNRITYSDMRMKYGIVRETAMVFNTETLKKHSFPVFEGEKFLPEGAMYYELDMNERFIVRNKTILVGKYLENGLTKNLYQNWLKNREGTIYALRSRFNASKHYLSVRSLAERIATIANIQALNMACKVSVNKDVPSGNLMSLVCLPFALLFKMTKFGNRHK